MSKTIAIMQPYFFPYIGYWQLMNAVDQFIVYDNVQFTKKGWINRNRFLRNGKPAVFSIPVKKGASHLNVNERYLSDGFQNESCKILRKIEAAYKKAPNFDEGFSLFEECLHFSEQNLFDFTYNSILKVKEYLGIATEIVVSSKIDCDHSLRSKERVKEICKAVCATNYVNPIGGVDIYSKDDFRSMGINLAFHKSLQIEYPQFSSEFVPWLSVLDVIMFNGRREGEMDRCLEGYNLV